MKTWSVKQLESIENDLNLHTELSQRNDDRIQDIEDKIKNSKSLDLSSSVDGAVSGDLMDKMRALAKHVNNIEAANDKKFNGLHADIHSVAKNMEYIEQDLKDNNLMVEECFHLQCQFGTKSPACKRKMTISTSTLLGGPYNMGHIIWEYHMAMKYGPYYLLFGQ